MIKERYFTLEKTRAGFLVQNYWLGARYMVKPLPPVGSLPSSEPILRLGRRVDVRKEKRVVNRVIKQAPGTPGGTREGL